MMGFHLFSTDLTLKLFTSPDQLNTVGGNELLTSALATGNETGGKSPYTYLWEFVSGDSFTINDPTLKSTTFQSNDTDVALLGIYKCTVTDDNSDTASDNISVAFQHGTPP